MPDDRTRFEMMRDLKREIDEYTDLLMVNPGYSDEAYKLNCVDFAQQRTRLEGQLQELLSTPVPEWEREDE